MRASGASKKEPADTTSGGPLRRIRQNFAKTLSGQGGVVALSLLAVTINTRALGVERFGALIVIQSVSQLMTGIFSFQTWQAMIRFGSDDLAEGQFGRLRARYRFGLALDTVAAVVATAVAVAAMAFFGGAFNLAPEYQMLGAIFALSGLFQGSTASVGILRLTDRFGLVMMLQIAGATLLLVNAIWLAASRQPLAVYVYTIGAITALNSGMLIVAGWRRVEELIPESLSAAESQSIDRAAFLSFSFVTSFSGTLSIFRQRGEVVLVSAFLGPAGAGLYGAAYRVASTLARFAEAGRQAVYPEIAGLVSQGDKAAAKAIVWKTIKASSLAAVPVYAALLTFGDDVLGFGFGAQYGAAYPNLIWLMTSDFLYACSFALAPFIQVTYGAGRFLAFNATAFGAFVLGGIAGPVLLGTAGAGMGAAIFSITLVALLSYSALGPGSTDDSRARSPRAATVLDGGLE